jgi:hypothetical protein
MTNEEREKIQAIKFAQISGTFDAARKLQCHPRDPTFIGLVTELLGNDEDLKIKARIMLVEYDKEFNATIVSNGNKQK